MRPVQLEFTAFGSYPGHESVDFDALAGLGLFLVTGPTGAGKTTIFDAMTYALYGKVAGDRPVDVRSHHATAEPTSVTFTFDVDGRRYRVERSPEQERAAKRGKGSAVEKASASLEELVEGRWVGLEAKATDATRRCIELVGLDAEQFQKVMLLPQGKFADFLLEGTDNRQKLLRKLFGTALFDQAVNRLKEQRDDLGRTVSDIDVQIEYHRRNAQVAASEIGEHLGVEAPFAVDATPTVDEVLAAVDTWEAVEQERKATADVAAGFAQQARAACESAMSGLERFDRYRELTAQLALLEDRHADIAAIEARVAAARLAAPVVAAADRAHRRATELQQADTALTQARAAVVTAAEALGVTLPESPSEASVAFAQLQAEAEALLARFDAASTARATTARCAATHQAAERAEAAAREQCALLAATLVDHRERHQAVLPIADRCGVLDAEFEQAKRLANDRATLVTREADKDQRYERTVTATAHAQSLRQAYHLGAAVRLAAVLQPGEPCAVCGSTAHPRPASGADDSSVPTLAEVDAAEQVSQQAAAAHSTVAGTIEALCAALGEAAHQSVDELEAAARAVAAELAAAEQARATRDALVEQMEDLTQRLDTEQKRHTAAVAALAAAKEAHAQATVSEAQAQQVIDGIDQSTVSVRHHQAGNGLAGVPRWEHAVKALTSAQASATDAESALATELSTHGFADVDAAREVWHPAAEVDALSAEVESWKGQCASTATGLAELERLGVPAEAPDVDALGHRADTAEAEARELTRRLTLIQQRRADLQQACTEVDRIAGDAGAVRDELAMVKRLYASCSGTDGHRVSLESWVLAGELERVAAHATVHLQRMSKGRYELLRVDSAGNRRAKAGLDLMVLDAHTGKPRQPSTLSGGERFQASLALALGLADVISQGGAGSGRVFEALFVDEGFGALDPDALDDAIEALQQLHASGRMVGAITHVEAMKQSLRTGIDVRQRSDGRGSTLVQPNGREG